MNNLSKILVLGANGFVGKNLVNYLKEKSYLNVVEFTRKDVDLIKPKQTRKIIQRINPDIIINCAGYVGGIKANVERKGDFYYNNLMIGTNVMNAALYCSNLEVIINIGAGCGYPETEEILFENMIFNGLPQSASMPYSMAKKMLIVQSIAYYEQYSLDSRMIIPGNIYGKFDNFDLESSHVVPALIHKAHLVKIGKSSKFEIWGDGSAVRDFVYVEDVCWAIEKILKYGKPTQYYNFSGGVSSIKEVVEILREIVSLPSEYVQYNSTVNIANLVGQCKRQMSNEKFDKLINNDNQKRTDLDTGLFKTYQWFAENFDKKIIRK